ncbi:Hsp70 family protein [Planctomicrobium sp. SH664]|uniref:Hsp70 family protein n=1 Tax=Planctomicrobium sp. SH664 TaxID=3448125 RepID=UPI003F5C9256
MATGNVRAATVPVGIDLGTTYSSLAYLTSQGQPVTAANSAGELSTPSVVLFDEHEVLVGTEALRQSITYPERAVLHAKRFMGDRNKVWVMDGRPYRPKDIAAFILKSLLTSAEEVLGKIRHAVITVPAQFSDLQRQDTVEAGLQAGLERVDIINEPVAAALCYVLGEGMWFAELAEEQTVLVFDLGGGTFDLSLVKYNKSNVQVLASGGDLKLGGLDWNKLLEEFACDEYIKQSISDPRLDRESLQALTLEVEQVKRSLSVRPRSTLVVQHEGRRKAYVIERDYFELLSHPLLERLTTITNQLLRTQGRGWAQVDAVLVTGGSSRMPMVRNMLNRISGTTPNHTLSPDQSICHGAAYYAGMLQSGRKLESTSLLGTAQAKLGQVRQQSVSGRGLGILVRDKESAERRAHYLIPANTPLPCAYRQRFGTALPNQNYVHLHIIESGTAAEEPYVEIGDCKITGLPDNMPAGSPVEVTISYDEEARIHVEAIDLTSGSAATTVIARTPPQRQQVPTPAPPVIDPFVMIPSDQDLPTATVVRTPSRNPKSQPSPDVVPSQDPPGGGRRTQAAPLIPPVRRSKLEDADRPVPLCNQCGAILGLRGECRRCDSKKTNKPAPSRPLQPFPGDENASIHTDQTEPIPVLPPPRETGGQNLRKKRDQ